MCHTCILKLNCFVSRAKRGAAGKKGSLQHSATDMAEVKDGRRKKEKKDEKCVEDKMKFCKSGLWQFWPVSSCVKTF